MRVAFALIALALFALTPAHAAPLDDLRRALTELRGATPLRAKVDSSHRRSDGKEKSESSGTSTIEDDGAHIRLVHDKNELRRRVEKKNRADHSISAAEALDLMNYAPKLLKTLEGATLKKVSQTTLDGTPATLLEITPLREKDEDGDKWVKSYVDTLLVWLGPGNIPIAAERTQKIKARIVVVGVEFNSHEKYRFARTADRLLVTRHSDSSTGSGLGQSESGVRTAVVTVVP